MSQNLKVYPTMSGNKINVSLIANATHHTIHQREWKCKWNESINERKVRIAAWHGPYHHRSLHQWSKVTHYLKKARKPDFFLMTFSHFKIRSPMWIIHRKEGQTNYAVPRGPSPAVQKLEQETYTHKHSSLTYTEQTHDQTTTDNCICMSVDALK